MRPAAVAPLPGALRGARHAVLGTLSAVLLAACATPGPPPPAVAAAPTVDTPFELSARVAVRRGDDSAAANLRWRHAPPGNWLIVSSPFGQTLAELEGEAGAVQLTLADGTRVGAPDWPELTERALGVPLPVAGLAWWIRGWPRPGFAHTVERDAAGRVVVLRQDGWEMVYRHDGEATRAAADSANGATAGAGPSGGERPNRIHLAYPGIDVRIVVDAWR